jgi:hypothetical protein
MLTFQEFLESKKHHSKKNKLVSDVDGEPIQIPGDTDKPKKGKIKYAFDIDGELKTIRGMKKK